MPSTEKRTKKVETEYKLTNVAGDVVPSHDLDSHELEFKKINKVSTIFETEKYCPNCKQNIHPSRDWSQELATDIILLIVLIFFLGAIGLGLWILVVFLSMLSPFNTMCPICKTPRTKLEQKINNSYPRSVTQFFFL